MKANVLRCEPDKKSENLRADLLIWAVLISSLFELFIISDQLKISHLPKQITFGKASAFLVTMMPFVFNDIVSLSR